MDTTFSLQPGYTDDYAPVLCHTCGLHVDLPDVPRHARVNHRDDEPRVIAKGHTDWRDGRPPVTGGFLGRLRRRMRRHPEGVL